MPLPELILQAPPGDHHAWDTRLVHDSLQSAAPGGADAKTSLRSTERLLEDAALLPAPLRLTELRDEHQHAAIGTLVTRLDEQVRRRREQSLVIQIREDARVGQVLMSNDGRMGRRWCYLADDSDESIAVGLGKLAGGRAALMWPQGALVPVLRRLSAAGALPDSIQSGHVAFSERTLPAIGDGLGVAPGRTMNHLDRLEAESIAIIREVMALAENPVMLYSLGKDSSVMLHLARKAFYPGSPPFPLLHIDTRWKFQAMYAFRDRMAEASGMELLVHVNPEGVAKNINPFDHGSALHTDIMKTVGLKQALDAHGFDVAFGGARRDEEKSRAKERVFSFRSTTHQWDPRNQRPELWHLYNGHKQAGESIRVFPLSNWTELDIWQYILREQIEIVPLYFAAQRAVVERDGMLMLVDDERAPLFPDETVSIRSVRFRTLGCYPLTGAIESDAQDLEGIVLEILQSRNSERQGRAIDKDVSGSMEKKKREGYF